MTSNPEIIFVQCNEPLPDVDMEAQAISSDGAEPELIGRKASDEEAADAAAS